MSGVTQAEVRAAKARWDTRCAEAIAEAKHAAAVAERAGDDWVAKWLYTSAGQLRLHQVLFAGRRIRPGQPTPSNWYYDAPQLQDSAYAAADQALGELVDFWHGGLDLGWDWSRGFPPGWPTSLWDRVHAWVPITLT